MTKILVAEDERDIRELIGYTLRFGGFEVTLATNGAEAIEMANTEDPDLIILDVRMPRMTGYEACEKLKQDPQVRHIPVVFLSAKGQEAEIRQGIEAGAVGYIIKPFVPDELVRQVREILEKTASAAEPAGSPTEAEDTAAAPPAAPVATTATAPAPPAAPVATTATAPASSAAPVETAATAPATPAAPVETAAATPAPLTAPVQPSSRETEPARPPAEPSTAKKESRRRRFSWPRPTPDPSDSGAEHSGSSAETSESKTEETPGKEA